MANRRQLLKGAATAGLFAALRPVLAEPTAAPAAGNAGPGTGPFPGLVSDPGQILDLPAGFSYRVLSRMGETMDDGLLVPGNHDGMAAFAARRGRVALVRNHELDMTEQHMSAFGPAHERLGRLGRHRLYDPGTAAPAPGGTTTVLYDPRSGRVDRHFLSLAGTERNCAGGPTPWGSWLTCEETVERAGGPRTVDHGWVFEVPSSARSAVEPVPLEALGRFNHEAAAVDPRTGIVYLTEDEGNGLFYRLLPARPGKLRRGGRLQALALADWSGSADTRNWPGSLSPLPQGQPCAARWVDLADTHAPDGDLRLRGAAAGAAVFARGEGIWFGDGEIYFACTSGGYATAGQIFRYRPSADEGSDAEDAAAGRLELFVESTDRRVLDSADNLTVTPWCDLLVCEDADDRCSLVGVTPQGLLYHFAENAYTESELAGVCFAPDGRTLFVNVQAQGLTLAIEGPFPERGTA